MQSDHDGVKVENWLPVFPEDVQADVALKVDIGVVDLPARQKKAIDTKRRLYARSVGT